MNSKYGYTKLEADYLIKISIFSLNELGFFKTDKHEDWAWNKTGLKVRIVSYMDEDGEKVDNIIFWYPRIDHEGKIQYAQYIDLEKTPCNFGGERFWFLCNCGRRVGVLYYRNNFFACRHCNNLTYVSKNVSGIEKVMGRIISIPELEEIERKVKRLYYKGKLTKKYQRFLEKEKFIKHYY